MIIPALQCKSQKPVLCLLFCLCVYLMCFLQELVNESLFVTVLSFIFPVRRPVLFFPLVFFPVFSLLKEDMKGIYVPLTSSIGTALESKAA